MISQSATTSERHPLWLRLLNGAAAAGMFALSAAALAQDICSPVGKLETGPHDYRAPPPDVLFRVEKFHYNADVENIRKGLSTVNIGEDLEFVLRYFPNHSRALNSMLKLGIREKTNRPRGNKDTIDCWFQRATTFRPDDGTVNLLYGLWLISRGERKQAQEQLERARTSMPKGNANYVYNLGLAYFEVGQYDRSLEAAHAAYALGYPLPGLRTKLEKAGKWRPPSPADGSPDPAAESGDAKSPAKPVADPAKP